MRLHPQKEVIRSDINHSLILYRKLLDFFTKQDNDGNAGQLKLRVTTANDRMSSKVEFVIEKQVMSHYIAAMMQELCSLFDKCMDVEKDLFETAAKNQCLQLARDCTKFLNDLNLNISVLLRLETPKDSFHARRPTA